MTKKVSSYSKKFKCPHCEQTSKKKSNSKIHIQRKHKKQMEYNKYDSQVYQNNILSQNIETLPTDVKNSFQQPSSLISGSPFNPLNEYYYFEKEKEEEEEERERKRKRRYQNMLFMYNKFCARQYNINNNNYYNNQPSSFPTYITSNNKQQTTIPNQYFTINSNPQISNPASKIPYAIKFYKCLGCSHEILFPIYDFKEIASIKEFDYGSFCLLFHKIHSLANLGKLLKDCLLYYIKTNPSCENTTLKTITIPNLFIETPFPLVILDSLSKIYEPDDPLRWLFELLTVDTFIEVGEIGSDHWAIRAYNSKPGNNIVLDRKELKEFVTITDASFGLIKFKKDNISRYIFSWIPLSKYNRF
jgi:hypothetical protein